MASFQIGGKLYRVIAPPAMIEGDYVLCVADLGRLAGGVAAVPGHWMQPPSPTLRDRELHDPPSTTEAR